MADFHTLTPACHPLPVLEPQGQLPPSDLLPRTVLPMAKPGAKGQKRPLAGAATSAGSRGRGGAGELICIQTLLLINYVAWKKSLRLFGA